MQTAKLVVYDFQLPYLERRKAQLAVLIISNLKKNYRSSFRHLVWSLWDLGVK